ncbi:MAG: PorP/SprF family type IX secretion system membrane protein [Flavobacteriales bacterium]|nr:PorP/SprF family type IX secretion system membrane protein [Flavobacteriales bacterium]
MKRKIISIIFVFILSNSTKAQDPIFTQSAIVPQTLNSNFAGFFETTDAGIIHRIQWPNEQKEINTSFFYVSDRISEKWSLRATALNHHETFTDYNFSQINLASCYKIMLGNEITNKVLSFGVEVGYGMKNYNFGGLLLEDQINTNNGNINPVSNDPFIRNSNDNVAFFDFSAAVLYNNKNYWLGITLKHLNTPNITFNQNGKAPLDIFTSVHGKYVVNKDIFEFLPDDSDLFLSLNFMKQSQYNRLDIGTGLTLYKSFTIGLTAATNPIRKADNSHFLTSINPLANYIFSLDGNGNNQFRIGASYDINTSKFGNNKGVYEFSITWMLNWCSGCSAKDNNYWLP